MNSLFLSLKTKNVGNLWLTTIHFAVFGVYHSSMRFVRAAGVVLALAALVATLPARVSGNGNGVSLRLHGSVEPVRSHPIVVPRLSGSGPGTGGPGTLVIVRLVKPGTRVKRGDLLIEFDRQAQIKTAHDRQAEYRDFVEQINKKRGEQITASAHGEAELKTPR